MKNFAYETRMMVVSFGLLIISWAMPVSHPCFRQVSILSKAIAGEE